MADEVFERAVTAACSVLVDVPRDDVATALNAAGKVYDQAHQAEIDRVMRETGFAGMEVVDDGVQLRLKYAADFASAVVSAFDALIETRGAENYVEWESTITDPGWEQAAKAGVPYDERPPLRKYHFIVVRPGGRTPHELRQAAEAERDRVGERLAALEGVCREAGRPDLIERAGMRVEGVQR